MSLRQSSALRKPYAATASISIIYMLDLLLLLAVRRSSAASAGKRRPSHLHQKAPLNRMGCLFKSHHVLQLSLLGLADVPVMLRQGIQMARHASHYGLQQTASKND
jgi:hypothetical protein